MIRRDVVLALITLFTLALPMSIGQTANYDFVIVKIDESGVAKVYMNVSIAEGITSIVLPIKPIDLSMEVLTSTSVEWLLVNSTLYIVSPKNTTVSINYIANVTIANNVFQINVSQPVDVRLVIASNILLLSISNEITFYGGAENETMIGFKGPATISYTIIYPTTKTTTISTTSATTPAIATTKSLTAVAIIQTSTSLTTTMPIPSYTTITQPTTSKAASISYTVITTSATTTAGIASAPSHLLVIGVAIAVLIVVAIIVVLLIKRR